ncbi:GlsB/YeaQ/YmgE family stress response membrane protein [Actinomadura darangshiensis]|uniref:GlsB/YeaQ/YmgE family stress response membrane protein n=1 Tax=Actinomadura darangshiensis TaxID=705336 RepID=A0A4R5ARI0_9ACTN|nr:GlsB/YeaQ/YmgE family stress response membrane protein [Actinomadura darangshiensis]TDD74825.1 GlsB/YeaQ/YmgE family stress response membrane protein [Actinomadura darangshiensis]
MTIGGLAAAVVLGAVIGALGRLVVPGRPTMPAWALMAVGVVAAFAGTGLVHVFELGDGGWSLWEALFQVGLAVVGVLLAAAFWPKQIRRPH